MNSILASESTLISHLIRNPKFRLDVANLMKPADKQYGPNDLPQIALSQSRLYAVIASAKTLVALSYADDLWNALEMLAEGTDEKVVKISNDIAHWTWASMQPVLGGDRMERAAFVDTDELPADEVEKDRVRIAATARFLLECLIVQTSD